MSRNRTPRVALRWTPQGKRNQGRPKATLQRTVEKDIKKTGLTVGDAEMDALDKIGWRQRVEASYSARSKEQEEEGIKRKKKNKQNKKFIK